MLTSLKKHVDEKLYHGFLVPDLNAPVGDAIVHYLHLRFDLDCLPKLTNEGITLSDSLTKKDTNKEEGGNYAYSNKDADRD